MCSTVLCMPPGSKEVEGVEAIFSPVKLRGISSSLADFAFLTVIQPTQDGGGGDKMAFPLVDEMDNVRYILG